MYRNTKRTVAAMIASAVAAMTFTFATPSAAFADPSTNDTVTAGEIASALNSTDNQNGKLVAEPIKSTTDADSAAVAKVAGTVVDIPKDASDGVTFGQLDIQLPNADEAGAAKRLADGTVVYPSGDGSANALIPTDNGLQMLVSIANHEADTRYTYKPGTPEGGKIEIVDGGVVVSNADGTPYTALPAPWARDANRTTVPSHYETDGKTSITLVVQHTSANAFPVVADPFWIPAAIAWKIVKCGGSGTLAWITAGGFNWWQRLLISVGACVFSL